jgi:hypothetical protein
MVTLDPGVSSGQSMWWMRALLHTTFNSSESQAIADIGVRTTMHRCEGPPCDAYDWFPSGQHFGMVKGVLDAYIHYGITFIITEYPVSCTEPEYDTQVRIACLLILIQLEAASVGVSPVVFACLLVHAHDGDFHAYNDDLEPCDAPVVSDDSCASNAADSTTNKERRVAAVVSVLQTHTFTLTEMLTAYASMGVDSNPTTARTQVSGALDAIALQIRRAAHSYILKLNMDTDNVVFCPELVEIVDDDDEWELRGYGFKTSSFDPVHGMPYLLHYNTRTCKRIGHVANKEGYCVACVQLLMLFILTAAIRMRFGATMAEFARQLVMANAHTVDAAAPNAAAFVRLLKPLLTHARVERDPLSTSTIDQLCNDFAQLFADPVGDASSTKITATLVASRLINAYDETAPFDHFLRTMCCPATVPYVGVGASTAHSPLSQLERSTRVSVDAAVCARLARYASV